MCRKHHVGAYATEPSPERSLAGTYGATTGGRSGASGGIQKTWSSLKSATSTLQHTAAGGTTGSARRPYGGASGSATANSIKEKYEQRLLDVSWPTTEFNKFSSVVKFTYIYFISIIINNILYYYIKY